MSTSFSIKASCNIIFESGYTIEETETEIIKLREAGKINNGHILSEDLPEIKKLHFI
jgi:hypothetical protein